jgi:phospholipid/cholesterol/gamma-HCH transport system substrate-binding protein
MSRTFRLGVFIVAALVIFGVGVFWIGDNQMLFEAKYRLNADFTNVGGLEGGAGVRVAGIRKGTVRRIDLPQRPEQKVRVEMDLDKDTQRVIKNNSTASIRSEGLMGDEYVEITPGTDEAPQVKDNGTLTGEQPVEISDLVRKAGGLLDSASGAAGDLSSITAKINDGTGTMGALVNDKGIYQNVNKAASELQEDMEAAKHNFLLSGFFHKRGYEDSADLTKYEIGQLPPVTVVRRFSWPARQIFDKPDTAKLKSDKALRDAGTFLQSNPFGLAVVVGYSDMKGDAATEKVLTEARALVVRDYLVKNFKMDDTHVKTFGMGKAPDADDSGIAVLVYPAGFVPQSTTGTPGPSRQPAPGDRAGRGQ